MLKIALTGGIGTGKTYISKQFIEMGIPVYYADDEAKKLYQEDFVLDFFRINFGEAIFDNEKLNFAKLSQEIFSDAEKLSQVNAFIHPLVMERFNLWAKQQNTPAVIMESAIVFEGRLTSFFDKIWVVDAPLEVRISRIQKRNPNLTLEEIKSRIANQISQEEKCKSADLVIDNSY